MNSKIKVGFLIIGRLKSTRLPKKLFLEVKGKTIIAHMIERLKLAQRVDNIILCTSTNHQDKPLKKVAKDNNIDYYLGDPDDVLQRMLDAAKKFDLEYILTITADCPLVDPIYADKIVEQYLKSDADLIRQFDLPHGAFSYGLKVDALRKVVELKDNKDTEIWGRYFTDTGLFKILDLDVENSHHRRPGLRMTLDYQEDFEFFKTIYENLYVEGQQFSLTEVLNLLDENPEIIDINKNCVQKYKKRFVTHSEPKLKRKNKVESALIVGSGSIGKRHIGNLKKLGINNIVALRSMKGHYKKIPDDLNVTEVFSWEEALNQNSDIAIISNPSSLHLEAVKKVSKQVKGVFIEKPLSHSMDGCKKLNDELGKNRVVAFVGFNMMFHPILKNIVKFRENNDVGEIVNIQCQVGQWLPDWHPYEDYTNAYYARKDLGGGAALTLIHEIHFSIELSGLPIGVFGEMSTYEKLDLDVDVCSDLMIKHKTGAMSQIHLDFIQKPPHRSGTVSFERGWLSYDFSGLELVGQHGKDLQTVIWSDLNYDINQMYLDEMNEFVRYVEEGRLRHKFDVSTSLESLKVVDAFFESEKTGKKVQVDRNERFSF
tara:strand:+ start:2017 stop:3810 length:1794 start_codon:yes stop_codon:yes gene_type:complete